MDTPWNIQTGTATDTVLSATTSKNKNNKPERKYEQNQIRSRYNHTGNRQTLVDDIQQTQPETQQTQSKQIHTGHSSWSLDAERGEH